MPSSSNPTSKYIWQVLVPCNWNNGKPVRRRHHREWDKMVRRIAGGLTILQPGRGQWVDPETTRVHEDRVIPVMIMATEAEMIRIAEFTLQHYRQYAVMYFKMSDMARMWECNLEQRKKFDEQDGLQAREAR